jgi:F0F1-type ATP synthase epsilon subunit
LADTEFLFEDEKITIAVWEGTIYTDWTAVILFVASATVNLKSDRESLLEMKKNLEEQIKEIKASWNSDEIERAYLNLQKLTADMELLKIKERKWWKIIHK